MVLLKLNEKYKNDYLTLCSGEIFYRKDNYLNRSETVLDLDLKNNIEVSILIKQGILIEIEKEETIKENKSENKEKNIKKDKDKNINTNISEKNN
jgi:hypothetical protein